MLKYLRTVTVILILALTTSPTLAAICATTCASKSIMSAVNPDDMPAMTNCHEGSMKDKAQSSTEHKSTGEHKSCAMGAGCNLSQAPAIDIASKYALIDSPAILFPHFDFSENSVDLSPPLKPPA
jgi:hypothetical protein